MLGLRRITLNGPRYDGSVKTRNQFSATSLPKHNLSPWPPAKLKSQDGIPRPDIHIKTSARSRFAGPFKTSSGLDSYGQFDVTPVVGREFSKLQISEILQDDARICDLQPDNTAEEMKG